MELGQYAQLMKPPDSFFRPGFLENKPQFIPQAFTRNPPDIVPFHGFKKPLLGTSLNVFPKPLLKPDRPENAGWIVDKTLVVKRPYPAPFQILQSAKRIEKLQERPL